jgi:hypothetical protein
MKELTNGFEILKKMPFGTMLFEKVQFSEFEKFQTAFFIKEQRCNLDKLGKNPKIEFRSAIIEDFYILMLPVLVQFNFDENLLYECWFNYCGERISENFLDLAQQDQVRLVLIDDSNTVYRILETKNGVIWSFKQAVIAMKERFRWDMKEFDAARDKIFRQYPSVNELWQRLKNHD